MELSQLKNVMFMVNYFLNILSCEKLLTYSDSGVRSQSPRPAFRSFTTYSLLYLTHLERFMFQLFCYRSNALTSPSRRHNLTALGQLPNCRVPAKPPAVAAHARVQFKLPCNKALLCTFYDQHGPHQCTHACIIITTKVG